MRAVVVFSSWRPWSRLIVVGAFAGGLAACSSDTSRFGNPNGNPFEARASGPGETTGSVQAAPISRVSSQPLPPPPSASRPTTVASIGVSGGGQGLGSYTPSVAPAAVAPATVAPAPARALPPPPAVGHDITGSVARPPEPRAGWNWNGGTAVVVGPGETAESLARKYGVPASAILQANNLSSPSGIHPGQHLVIPRYEPIRPPRRGPMAPAASTRPAGAVAARRSAGWRECACGRAG